MYDGMSTIQRLQAVGKTEPTIDSQVEQVASILNVADWLVILPSHLTTAASPSPAVSSHHVCAGSLKWALRWSLSALGAAGDEGKQARASTSLWRLLTHLLNALPITTIARHLSTFKFVDILESTTTQINPVYLDDSDNLVYQHGSPSNAQQDLDPSLNSTKVTDAQGSSDDSASGKRKREVRSDPVVSRKRRRRGWLLDRDINEGLVLSIVSCTNQIFHLLTPAKNKNDEHGFQYLQHVFKTDCGQAARVLGNWVSVLRRTYHGLQTIARDPLPDLKLVLHIWAQSSIAAPRTQEDKTVSEFPTLSCSSSDDEFLKQCMEPILYYLLLLQSVDVPQMKSTLERLLVQHVWLPAKAAFRLQSRHSSDSQATIETYRKVYLSRIFDALVKSHEPSENILALLYDLAVRSCDLSTIKSKSSEAPWLERLSITLAECLGFPKSCPKSFSGNVVPLVRIFSTLNAYDVQLPTSTISSFAANYCGFRHGPNKSQWNLLFQMIKMNPECFVNTSPASVNGTPSADMTHSFFRAASQAHNTRHQVDGESGERSGAVGDSDIAYTIIHQALTPLMQAYSSARALDKFISRWHAELVETERERSVCFVASKPSMPSVWESDDLSVTLTQLLEPNMTIKQIESMIQHYSNLLNALPEAPSTDMTPFQLYADARVFHVLLSALNSDGVLRHLLPIMRRILNVLVIYLRPGGEHQKHKGTWQLLAMIHRKWLLIVDLERREDLAETLTVSESCLHTAMAFVEQLNTTADARTMEIVHEAMQAISDMIYDVATRHIKTDARTHQINNFSDYVHKQLTDNIQKDKEERKSDAEFLANFAARYIIVLAHDDSATARSARREVLETIFTQMVQYGSDDIEISLPWRFLIEQTCSSNQPAVLREDVVKILDKITETALSGNDEDAAATRTTLLLAAKSYILMPLSLVRKSLRVKLLDHAVSIIGTIESGLAIQTLETYLPLLIRLLALPHSRAFIGEEIEGLHMMANCIDKSFTSPEIEQEQRLISMFRQVIELVIQPTLSSEGILALGSIHSSLFVYLSEIAGRGQASITKSGTAQVVEVTLTNLLPIIRAQAPQMLPDMDKLQTVVHNMRHSSFRKHSKTEKDGISAIVNASMEEFRATIVLNETDLWHNLSQAAALVQNVISHRELQIIRRTLVAEYQALEVEPRRTAFQGVLSLCDGSALVVGALRLQGVFLQCVLEGQAGKQFKDGKNEISSITGDLSYAFICLCDKMMSNVDIKVFRLITDNLLLILKSKVRVVSS